MKANSKAQAKEKLQKDFKLVGFSGWIRYYFARYYLWDNYGTRKLCFTLAQAKTWLAYCGKTAIIGDRLKKKVILARVQN